MKAVWKFPLVLTSEPQTFLMPEGAEIIHVREQGGNVCMWALLTPSESTGKYREFQIFGTGDDEIQENHQYVGTAHIGPFVWHVFEVVKS